MSNHFTGPHRDAVDGAGLARVVYVFDVGKVDVDALEKRGDVVSRFLEFLRGQGDVDAIVYDPPSLTAHVYDVPGWRVKVKIDPRVLLRNHPKLRGDRSEFLDAASAQRAPVRGSGL